MEVHYSGFTIPDAFVVGYGLDYAEHYRNLPYIGILKPEGLRRLTHPGAGGPRLADRVLRVFLHRRKGSVLS